MDPVSVEPLAGREAPAQGIDALRSESAPAPLATRVVHKLPPPKRIPLFIAPIFILAPVFVAAMIAHNSINFAHPDEDVHVDSFRWFQTHWTPPELNAPELHYSGMGWSRVYTGEIVYPIYGKLSSFFVPAPDEDL